MQEQYIIVVGTIESGYDFVGPFYSKVEAVMHKDSFYKGRETKIVSLVNPAKNKLGVKYEG